MRKTRVGPIVLDYRTEMIAIYSLIDEGKIVEAFTKLRSSLFYMKNIPKVVHKLRLRFSSSRRVFPPT